eukprot:PhF_6_TR31730/c0_g1_i1/m.46700
MLSQAIAQTREILDRSGVDAGHGIDHALDVFHHVENMISSSPTSEVPQQYHDAIRLAALLHDVDDKKILSDTYQLRKRTPCSELVHHRYAAYRTHFENDLIGIDQNTWQQCW